LLGESLSGLEIIFESTHHADIIALEKFRRRGRDRSWSGAIEKLRTALQLDRSQPFTDRTVGRRSIEQRPH
jgi:hypothetical protein